jgi:hypothetical protein
MARAGILVAFVVACSHTPGANDPYGKFQDCFDDLVKNGGDMHAEAITLCILDHPIGGQHLMFSTLSDCVQYVGENLDQASASANEIQNGCQDYLNMK